MADTKTSALTAVTTPAGTDEFPVNQGGTSKKMTLTQINAYTEPLMNGSVADQGAGFSTDTYVTGSNVAIPAGRLQAKTVYRARIHVAKTAAGTATPIVIVRFGTAATTADTALVTLTHGAGTAAIDEVIFEINATFRTVGSSTTATLEAVSAVLGGLGTAAGVVGTARTKHGVSAGFDSTLASAQIGVSINGGTSAAWTVSLVQSELLNLI